MEELRIKYGVKVLNGKYNNYGHYTRIIIPPTVKVINESLNNLNTLEEVIFESEIDKNGNIRGIEYINNSFNNCKNLENIIFEQANNTKINDSFKLRKTLKKVY